MWAFATSSLDFYFYDVGYLRTSSCEYSTEEMKYSDLSHVDKSKEADPTIESGALELAHLTNNCLQIKNKETYGKHEEGNVVSFEQFQ